MELQTLKANHLSPRLVLQCWLGSYLAEWKDLLRLMDSPMASRWDLMICLEPLRACQKVEYTLRVVLKAGLMGLQTQKVDHLMPSSALQCLLGEYLADWKDLLKLMDFRTV